MTPPHSNNPESFTLDHIEMEKEREIIKHKDRESERDRQRERQQERGVQDGLASKEILSADDKITALMALNDETIQSQVIMVMTRATIRPMGRVLIAIIDIIESFIIFIIINIIPNSIPNSIPDSIPNSITNSKPNSIPNSISIIAIREIQEQVQMVASPPAAS
jgi:Mg2+/Co2+ transporter CorB